MKLKSLNAILGYNSFVAPYHLIRQLNGLSLKGIFKQ